MIKEIILEKKKLIITIIVILIFFMILKIVTYRTPLEKLELSLQNKGFILDGNTTNYIKQISDVNMETHLDNVTKKKNSTYESLYFDMDSYQLNKNEMSYEDDIESSFTPVYDYKKDTLTYNYRVVINNASAIFEGTYDKNTEKFTCVNIYSYNFDIERNEDIFCDKIKFDVEEFAYEARFFITSSSILEEIKKSK